MSTTTLKTVAVVSSLIALFSSGALAWRIYSENEPDRDRANRSSSCSKAKEYPPDLINEQLARNIAFLGEEGMNKIRNSTVVVVGAGGVGSWAATMLVRSGIGKLRIIDFDQVTLSSLNRHACAVLEDVGSSKVTCVANFLRRTAPWVEIEPIVALWKGDDQKCLDWLSDADYVIDCIDNIDTKVELLAYCYHNKDKFKFIGSMGAGCKGDPNRIRLADISQTIEDPLSRATRRRLKALGISTGVPVVFSHEKPSPDKANLLELEQSRVEEGQVNELSVLQDFRVRILPVLGPLPAIFGLTIATHILTDLGGYTHVYDPILGGYSMAGKVRTKLYDHALHSLVGQATRMGWMKSEPGVSPPINATDTEYIIEEVFSGKSITGESNRLVLTIWDPSKPFVLSNIVPVSKEQQKKHEELVFKEGKSLEEVYPQQVLDVVRQRQDLDKWYRQYR